MRSRKGRSMIWAQVSMRGDHDLTHAEREGESQESKYSMGDGWASNFLVCMTIGTCCPGKMIPCIADARVRVMRTKRRVEIVWMERRQTFERTSRRESTFSIAFVVPGSQFGVETTPHPPLAFLRVFYDGVLRIQLSDVVKNADEVHPLEARGCFSKPRR